MGEGGGEGECIYTSSKRLTEPLILETLYFPLSTYIQFDVNFIQQKVSKKDEIKNIERNSEGRTGTLRQILKNKLKVLFVLYKMYSVHKQNEMGHTYLICTKQIGQKKRISSIFLFGIKQIV